EDKQVVGLGDAIQSFLAVYRTIGCVAESLDELHRHQLIYNIVFDNQDAAAWRFLDDWRRNFLANRRGEMAARKGVEDASSKAATSGSQNQKVEPAPCSLPPPMRAPVSATSRFEMDNPKAVAPNARQSELSTCVNG